MKAALVHKFGPGELEWWRQGVPVEVRKSCVSTYEEDPEPAAEPYCYTTFINLSKIMDKQWALFSNILPKEIAKDKKKLSDNLGRLNSIRNRVMHPVKGLPMLEDDFTFVRDFHERIQLSNWRTA